MNFDLQVKYTYIVEKPHTYVLEGQHRLDWPVVVTIQSTVSFVFLAAIFDITIHVKLNFLFLGIIHLNAVCSPKYI